MVSCPLSDEMYICNQRARFIENKDILYKGKPVRGNLIIVHPYNQHHPNIIDDSEKLSWY